MTCRESDSCVVPKKPGNAGEGKAATNHRPCLRTHELHTGVDTIMETKLARIAEIARLKPEERFTSLYHLLNEEMLVLCHDELDGNKATGIDHVTKREYEENLEVNIRNLVSRLKTRSYRPQPVRRTYIPKGDGTDVRPLGIPAYEDKIVQLGVTKILQSIYESDFLDFSYGFRPRRSCHMALRSISQVIEKGSICYVVDADIRGFFNNMGHEWLMKFVDLRLGDPNMQKLIRRFLRAGVIEEGIWEPTYVGAPQGAVLSPLLANVYLHYALDLWFEKVVKKKCDGQAEMVRYADDFVCCFETKHDAERFYAALLLRLEKFGLDIAENKSKILMFGRFAEATMQRLGQGKPDTFDFLGFTHYCGKSRYGYFRVKRKTSRKKFNAKVKAFGQWIRQNRHEDTDQIMKTVAQKLTGHYRYYGVTDNSPSLDAFRYQVTKLMYKWLNRRSQRKSFTYKQFNAFLAKHPLPSPKIYVNIYG